MQQTSFSINYKRCIIDKLGKVHNPHRGPPSLPAPIATLEALSKNWNHQTPQNDKKYVFGKWQIKICLPITPILSIGRCYMSYILYFASLFIIFTCCQLALGCQRFVFFYFGAISWPHHNNSRQNMASARGGTLPGPYCACVVQLYVTQRWRHMTSHWRHYLFI